MLRISPGSLSAHAAVAIWVLTVVFAFASAATLVTTVRWCLRPDRLSAYALLMPDDLEPRVHRANAVARAPLARLPDVGVLETQ
jgi:hypothetical protein